MGKGKTIKNTCKTCGGTGIKIETEQVDITFPGGIFNGGTMKFEGLGSAPQGGGYNGDLYVTFDVKPDPYFEVVDRVNVVHYEEIPFNEAIIGCERKCKCLDGTLVTVKIPELTKDGTPFYFKGKGMPNINGSNKGDYAVVVKYKLPNKLTKKQREILMTFND